MDLSCICIKSNNSIVFAITQASKSWREFKANRRLFGNVGLFWLYAKGCPSDETGKTECHNKYGKLCLLIILAPSKGLNFANFVTDKKTEINFITSVRNFVINKLKKFPIILPQGFTNLKTLFSHVLMTKVCRGRDSNTQTSACKANVLTDCIIAVPLGLKWTNIYFACTRESRTLIWVCLEMERKLIFFGKNRQGTKILETQL